MEHVKGTVKTEIFPPEDFIETERYYESIFPQNSEKWRKYRKRITGSIIGKIVRNDLSFYKSGETFAGNYRMYVGTKEEETIRKWYSSFIKKEIIKPTFFILKEDIRFGSSPDGFIGDDEIVEFKITFSPIPESVSFDYVCQMNLNMYITGRFKCHFVMYSLETEEIYVDIFNFDPELFEEMRSKGIQYYERNRSFYENDKHITKTHNKNT